MRSRLAPLLAALALLVACGGDDDSAADDTTTTTEADSSSTTGSTIAAPLVATTDQIARVVVQIDDFVRTALANSRACMTGPFEQCTAEAQQFYAGLGQAGRQTRDVLPSLVTEGSDVYQGRPSADLQARIDRTVNLGAAVASAFDQADEVCVPDFPDECADLHAALSSALDELLKDFNRWRDDYDPAADPANQGQPGITVTED